MRDKAYYLNLWRMRLFEAFHEYTMRENITTVEDAAAALKINTRTVRSIIALGYDGKLSEWVRIVLAMGLIPKVVFMPTENKGKS